VSIASTGLSKHGPLSYRGARTESEDIDCWAAIGTSDSTRPQNPQAKNLNPRAVREAKLELLRDALHEACGFIRIHAEVCQALAEAGDDAGVLHALGRLITYANHAARTGRDLRTLRGGGQ
jgi:hypothetical protein